MSKYWPPIRERPPGRWMLWSEEWIALMLIVQLVVIVVAVTR